MTTPRFTLTHTPHTSRTSCTSDTKAVILNTFNSQPTGNERFLFIAAITINGTVHCTTTEATGPIQALCYMLDSLGIRLDIITFRQHDNPHNPQLPYTTLLEVENGYFTRWASGHGTTREEANLTALITAANQYLKLKPSPVAG